MLDLNLREVVSKGKQSVSSALKSKKGELMQVEYIYVLGILSSSLVNTYIVHINFAVTGST